MAETHETPIGPPGVSPDEARAVQAATMIGPRFRGMSAWDLAASDVPEPAWAFEGWLPLPSEGMRMLVSGAAKAGKSTMAMDLAFSVATGTDLFGDGPANLLPGPEPVLYVHEENSPPSIKRDLLAMAQARPGLGTVRGPGPTVPVKTMGEWADAWDSGDVRETPTLVMAEEVERMDVWVKGGFRAADNEHRSLLVEYVRSFGIKWVFLDPFYKMAPGLDINAPGPMSQVLDNLDEILRETGATVVLVHHSSVKGTRGGIDERMLGSSLLPGWYDAHWGVSKGATTGFTSVGFSFKEHEERTDATLRQVARCQWEVVPDFEVPRTSDGRRNTKGLAKDDRQRMLRDLIGSEDGLAEQLAGMSQRKASDEVHARWAAELGVGAETLRKDLAELGILGTG